MFFTRVQGCSCRSPTPHAFPLPHYSGSGMSRLCFDPRHGADSCGRAMQFVDAGPTSMESVSTAMASRNRFLEVSSLRELAIAHRASVEIPATYIWMQFLTTAPTHRTSYPLPESCTDAAATVSPGDQKMASACEKKKMAPVQAELYISARLRNNTKAPGGYHAEVCASQMDTRSLTKRRMRVLAHASAPAWRHTHRPFLA